MTNAFAVFARALRLARRTAAALAVMASVAFPALAETERWEGSYYCSQGITGMTLTVRERTGDDVVAEFLFYAHPSNPGVPTGCYLVEGRLAEGEDGVRLTPKEWIERPGDTWSMTPLKGALDADSQRLKGWIDVLRCGGFDLSFIGDGESVAPACRQLVG